MQQKLRWEFLWSDSPTRPELSNEKTYRAEVPGGWLYRHSERGGGRGLPQTWTTTMAFVSRTVHH